MAKSDSLKAGKCDDVENFLNDAWFFWPKTKRYSIFTNLGLNLECGPWGKKDLEHSDYFLPHPCYPSPSTLLCSDSVIVCCS